MAVYGTKLDVMGGCSKCDLYVLIRDSFEKIATRFQDRLRLFEIENTDNIRGHLWKAMVDAVVIIDDPKYHTNLIQIAHQICQRFQYMFLMPITSQLVNKNESSFFILPHELGKRFKFLNSLLQKKHSLRLTAHDVSEVYRHAF